MPTPRLYSRIHETSTTQGTGSYVLAGAVPGHLAFSSRVSAGNQVWYLATDGTAWETGVGTYQVSGSTRLLERTTIIETSLGTTSRIDWGPGTRDVFAVPPGSRVVTFRGDGKFEVPEVAFAATGKNSLSLVYGASNDYGLYDNTGSVWPWRYEWNYNGAGGKRLRLPILVYATELDADTLRVGGTALGTAATRTAHTPVTGTAAGATSTTVTLQAGESSVNDIYAGLELTMTSGAVSGQTRRITAYDGATRVATVTPAFTPAPAAGDGYSITTGPARAGTALLAASNGRLDGLLVGQMVGASTTAAGRPGAVPRPVSGDQIFFLRGDGTWKPPVNRYVETWRTSWANSSIYTRTHGLGTYPSEYWLELECVTAEHGYAVGDRFRVTSFGEQSTSRGVTVWANSTTVGVTIASAGIAISRRDATSMGVVTPANWKIRLVAQALWG